MCKKSVYCALKRKKCFFIFWEVFTIKYKIKFFLPCAGKRNHVNTMVLCYIHSSVLWNSFNNQLNHCAYSAVIHIVIHTVYYNSNTKLHHQQYIMSSTLHYIINDALNYQRCIMSSMLHDIINAVLHYQRCPISARLHYIINVALYHQRCIIHCTKNEVFHSRFLQ